MVGEDFDEIFKVTSSQLRQTLKTWMLPIAMATGIIFHNYMGRVQFLAPYLIFSMLLVTFCKVNPKELKIDRMLMTLLAVQLVGSIAVYFVLLPVSPQLAQGAFICVFCPTATAAPVITGFLGGSIARVAIYSISSNLVVALIAPLIFEYMGGASIAGEITFFDGFISICAKIGPLIILPLITAFVMRVIWPKAHSVIAQKQAVSFYIWAISLLIVVGRSVSFVMNEPYTAIPLMLALAGVSLSICCTQFYIGRKIGNRFGDKIAGAQSLAQKNTVLAIWMSLNFLSPISSVAPASYILWQNTINSAQLYFKNRKDKEKL